MSGDVEIDERKMDKSVGGGVDRDKIPAADFAGKNRSFPIVTPGDVSDAAASIGRAGADNYSAEELKRRIIRIAKRKGPSFVAQLPQAWREEMNEGAESPEPDEMLAGEFTPLVEKAVRDDGTVSLRLIGPGWGSSGYYGKKVLQRDVPKVFPPGTLMFWDHPTEAEEASRPEGSLQNLAGVLVNAPHWKEDGMYAEAKVFGPYRQALQELAQHIGVSIRALGRAKPGSAEGQKGQIVEEIAVGRSIDFVTSPGAGGRVLDLFEAARTGLDTARTGLDTARTPTRPAEDREGLLSEQAGGQESPENGRKEGRMTEELRDLQEANAALRAQVATLEQELARLREADLLRRAEGFVAAELAKVDMPEITRTRLTAQLGASPVVVESDRWALDEAKYREMVAGKAKAELAYLAEATGRGKVIGMGARPEQPQEDVQARMAEAFRGLGLSETAAQVAANGR